MAAYLRCPLSGLMPFLSPPSARVSVLSQISSVYLQAQLLKQISPTWGCLGIFLPHKKSLGKQQQPTTLLPPYPKLRPWREGSTEWMEGEESLALVSYLPVRRPPLSLGLHLPFCKTREGERDTYSLSNHPGNPSWRQRCIYLGKKCWSTP